MRFFSRLARPFGSPQRGLPGAAARPPPAVAEAPSEPEGFIRVRDLIARYSNAEHIARADAYFASIPDDSLLLRKPFFGLKDSPSVLYGVSEMLNGLQLFPGARVLDFGAGTGWLSKALSFLGCHPVACDVSAAALAIGRRAFERDPVAKGLDVDWRPFDGIHIPCADASMDRVICYDSFHHVADQPGVLREFYRVLRDGGIAGFHEPGPVHSHGDQSQYEMRHHDVIENDIVVADIWQAARSIGFTGLELTLAAPTAARVDIDTYTRLITRQETEADRVLLLDSVVRGADNLRIFYLKKGEEVEDSRFGKGLGGRFKIEVTDTGGPMLRGRVTATNTGHTRWRASVAEAGGVWIGVREPGAKSGPDYGRIKLSDAAVEPGETIEAAFELRAPLARPAQLMFDLVAENVAWFELFGSRPVTVTIE